MNNPYQITLKQDITVISKSIINIIFHFLSMLLYLLWKICLMFKFILWESKHLYFCNVICMIYNVRCVKEELMTMIGTIKRQSH